MIFSSSYKRSSISYQQQAKLSFNAPLNIHRPTTQNNIVVEQTPPPVKLKWGKPIWTFFHTMAQKMRGEYFRFFKRLSSGETLNIIDKYLTRNKIKK